MVREAAYNTLTKLAERTSETSQRLKAVGRGAIAALDIVPPRGAHAYRPGSVQLRVAEMGYTPPKHSKDDDVVRLSVEGIKQAPERPHSPEELNDRQLINQPDHMPSSHQPSWLKEVKKPSSR